MQAQPFLLAGAGAVIGDATIVLQSFTQIDGTPITMSLLGLSAYMTLEPGNGILEEQVVFTGVTPNSNGTATLTGVSSVGFAYPYAQVAGLAKTHAGSTMAVLSNTSGFYSRFVAKDDDGAISQTLVFTNPNYPQINTDSPEPTLPTQLVPKSYVDNVVVSGAPNASVTTKGIVQIATQAQVDAKTLVGSTSAFLVMTPDEQRSTLTSDYVIDTSTSPNFIKIAPSPSISAYSAGQVFSFKVANTNTSPTVSLNVNGLGAKNISLYGSSSPVAGTIVAGQMIVVEYDGTNAQVVSTLSGTVVTANTPSLGSVLYGNGSAWVSLPAGTNGQILVTGSPTIPAWQTFGSRVAIGTFTPSAGTGTKSVTGLAFRPSYVQLFATNAALGSGGTSGAMGASHGYATSSSARFCQSWGFQGTGGGNANAANAWGLSSVDTSNVLNVYTGGSSATLQFQADFTSMDAAGFTINATTNSTPPAIAYVAYQ